MATLRDDAARWFTLAAEARKLAEGLMDPEAKRKMLDVADNCMTIAPAWPERPGGPAQDAQLADSYTTMALAAKARADALVEINEQSG